MHSHLRDVPNLDAATVDRQVVPLTSSDFPAQLELENSLSVRTFGGPLTLCQRPTQAMAVTARGLQEPAVRSAPVTLMKASR